MPHSLQLSLPHSDHKARSCVHRHSFVSNSRSPAHLHWFPCSLACSSSTGSSVFLASPAPLPTSSACSASATRAPQSPCHSHYKWDSLSAASSSSFACLTRSRRLAHAVPRSRGKSSGAGEAGEGRRERMFKRSCRSASSLKQEVRSERKCQLLFPRLPLLPLFSRRRTSSLSLSSLPVSPPLLYRSLYSSLSPVSRVRSFILTHYRDPDPFYMYF